MTDAASTTLPIAPRDFGFLVFVLGLILLTGLVFLLLQGVRVGTPRTGWKARLETEGWKAALNATGLVLALVWIALFLLAIWAAFFGTYQLLVPRSSAAPAPGLGALGIGTLLGALLGGPFLVWGTWLKHRTVGFQKEGHLTDRISKAVEQLGAEKTVKKDGKEETEANIEVRIGGILSLERIAQDSTEYDKGRDHVRVMEILCAYIRQNAPASEAKDHEFGELEPLKDGATAQEREAHEEARRLRFGDAHGGGKISRWAQTLPEPRADIDKALLVIGRRSKAQRQAEARWGKDAAPDAAWVFDEPCPSLPEATDAALNISALETYLSELRVWQHRSETYCGYQLDLSKTNLQRANLMNLCLSGANLTEARMEGALLTQARLEGADLTRARMEGAQLWMARMVDADLTSARMEGANLVLSQMEGTMLVAARMEGALLWQARMVGANLSKAQMAGADFTQARMEGTNLSNAQMERVALPQARMERASLWGVWMAGADLSRARLERADFSNARMEGANLSQARMERAVLVHTQLEGADLRLAFLAGADFSGAWLNGANLWKARLDETTLFEEAVLHGAKLRSVDCSTLNITPEQLHACFGDGSTTLPTDATQNRPPHWPKGFMDSSDFDSEWRKWLASPDTYTPPSP